MAFVHLSKPKLLELINDEKWLKRINEKLFLELTNITLLAWSIHHEDYKEIYRILDTNPEYINHKTLWKEYPIHYAETRKMIELLLRKGANINAHSIYGRVIDKFVYQNYLKIVKFLLKKGATLDNIKPPSMGDCTIKTINFILKNGFDINKQSGEGETLLIKMCAYPNKYKIVKFLLKKGARMDINVWGGVTPLMRAVAHNSVKSAKLLIKYGASLDDTTAFNENIYEAARRGNSPDTMRLVLKLTNLSKKSYEHHKLIQDILYYKQKKLYVIVRSWRYIDYLKQYFCNDLVGYISHYI